MIAEVREGKRVNRSAKPVTYPPGLKPSLIKNQYQSLPEKEEEDWTNRESQRVKHEFAPVQAREIAEVRKLVKIGIDSCAAETVCPKGWASELKMETVKPEEQLNLVNASGGPIRHYGGRKVVLQT